MALWKSTERVALRLEKSNFDSLKHWRALLTIPQNNPSEKVWDTFSRFLASCSDEMFESFFNKFSHKKLELGEFLEILHENSSNGEEIFAFLLNISPALGGRRIKKIDDTTEIIKKILRSDPNFDLVKIGKLYNLAQGNNGNNFLTYQQWQDFLRTRVNSKFN